MGAQKEAQAVSSPRPQAGPAARRRMWMFAMGEAGLLLVAVVVAVTAAVVLRPATGIGAQTGAVVRREALEIYRGRVAAMRDTEGLDLDLGVLAAQTARGIDITPWGQGNHLVTKSGASMALLEEPGAETFQRCAAVPAEKLVTTVKGLYAVPAPRNMCVWTREGRVAMLTLDETPSARSGTLALRYVVWQPPGGSPPGQPPAAR